MISLCDLIPEIFKYTVPLLIGLSAMLFLASLIFLFKEKNLIAQQIDWFNTLSFPKKCATIALLCFFTWWGGAKEGGISGGSSSNLGGISPSNLRPAATVQSIRSLPEEISTSTNAFAITAFEVSQEDQMIAFETKWLTNLFDYTDSGNVYLFVSTNLLEQRWTPLGLYAMPAGTNVYAFSISEQEVEVSSRQRFRESFSGRGFYRFGIDFDSDDDGLADSVEQLWFFTDPTNFDTDNDGLSDGEELLDGINSKPLVYDTDGDGLRDGEEIAVGSNPNKLNSDNDAFSDAQEIGTMTLLKEEQFLWFDVSDGTDLTANYSSVNGSTWTIPLASSVTINNVVYTNALIGMEGVVHLLCPTNPSKSAYSSYNPSGGLSNYQWSVIHTTVALCNANLYAQPLTWGSKILYGSVNSEGRSFSVIEYCNVGLYETRATNELITCQLILPADETNTVYVSYLSASNTFREVDLTVGVQCGGIPSFKSGEKYYNLSWPLTANFPSGDTTIKYTIGTGTNPTKMDTDEDGLSDSDELLVYGTDPFVRDSDGDGVLDDVELSLGTNPCNADTDGDGMPDGWEIRHELDPLLIDAEGDADVDGLDNSDEYMSETNPRAPDTDGDGLSDRDEIGRWEYAVGLPTFNTSAGTNLLQTFEACDSAHIAVPLPFAFMCAGYLHTNVTASLDGVVALMSNRENASFSVGYGNSKIDDCSFSSYHTVIAAYWDDLYAKPDEGTQIRVADITVGARRYAVIEYDKVRFYSQKDDVNATGRFQIILPQSDANTVYVRYVDMSSAFNGSSASIGAQLPKKELSFDVAFNQVGSVTNGMTIAYRFGPGSSPLIADTDGDGLNDGEEFAQGTSVRYSDTDNDGLVDSWEIQNELDPMSAIGFNGADGDPDGDHLSNEQESDYGTYPILADTDGDGLNDGNETGNVFESNALPWLSFETVEDLTGEITNVYGRCVSRPMPQALTIQGESVTNLTISANGLLFLNKAGYVNTGNSTSSCSFDYAVNKNALVIAPYLSYAYYRSDVLGKETSVKLGTATHQNDTYLLVEYANIHETSSRYQTNSISFQIAIPLSSPDRAYVRYKDLTGNYMTGEDASIGMQTFDGVWMHSYCYREKGKVWGGLSLEFLFGFNADPLGIDTDGDGLNDGYEVSIGTAPTIEDSDGDGLPDNWELDANLDPLCVEDDDGGLGDPDGDGLENRLEFERGTNPRLRDSDNDGLSDDAEVVVLSLREDFPWFETTEITNLTEAVENSYQGIVDFKLPAPVFVQDKSVDSITFDRRGIFYLNPSGYQNPKDIHSVSDLEASVVDANCFTIVPYFASLFLSDEPLPSVISIGTAEYDGREYLVLEGTNMYRRLTSSITNAISFQIAFSSTGRVDRIHLTYVDLVGEEMDGEYAVIGAQSFGVKDCISYCEYEPGKVHDGMGLTLVIGYGSNPLETDTDEDGIGDGTEVYVHGSSPMLLDSDTDGLADSEEVALGTAPGNSDTDGDGLLDRWEVMNNLNPLSAMGNDGAEADNDQDGLTNLQEQTADSNPRSADTDGDGLGDAQELQFGTKVANVDTDRDGLTDKQEIDAGHNPSDPDMDRDGLIDGWEVAHGLNPQSSDGVDGADGDPDGDGLSNIDEYEEGTDPKNSDTDGDGVSDSDEVSRGSDPTNSSDGGQAPAEDRFRTIQFNINGDYATWEMTVEGLGPNDTRTRKITMARPNAAATTNLRLRKGNSYRLSMRWLNCDGHNDNSAPWYCWQAQLDGLPSRQSFNDYSNVRLEGNELIFGDGWFVENANGLLTSHIHECTTKFDGSFGGGNVAGSLKATLYVLDDPKLIPDSNRDGVINDADKDLLAQGKRLRFWINDDADSKATDGKYAESPDVDIPGAGPGFLGVGGRKPDCQDDEVNGWCDLLDLTPLCMDISALSVLPEEVRENLTFKICHDEGAVNVVWTGLSKSSVGAFKTAVVDSCGENLDENSFEATTEQVTADGIDVPEKLAAELRKESTDKGVFFLEGRAATQTPLKIEVYFEDKKLIAGEMSLSISSVEDMYRWLNIRPVAGGGVSRQTDLSEPSNFPDGESNGKMFVFVHGYSVSEEGARGWNAEMFKRLWQSGANSMYTAVTWYGNDSQAWWWLNETPNYYINVVHAFESAGLFSSLVNSLPGSQKIVAAHSLGNMLASSAIADSNVKCSQYFMFNAAVPLEAYAASAITPQSSLSMCHPDWQSYSNKLWASHWYELFPTNDMRSRLTWRGRFSSVTNAVNFYSSEEDVLANGDGALRPFLSGDFAWINQEMRKGIWPYLVPGNNEAGWSFNSDYDVPVTNFLGVVSNERCPPSKANIIDDSLLRTNSFFGRFDYEAVYGENGSVEAGQVAVCRQILADAIPAESFAAGCNAVVAWKAERNVDMQTYLQGNSSSGRAKWFHSDVKKLAYFYISQLFDLIVNIGGLK